MNALLIDIGNSRLKLAQYGEGQVTFLEAVDIHAADDCRAALKRHWQGLPTATTDIWAVSVASQTLSQVVQTACPDATVHWVYPQSNAAGVRNAYPDPSQLGPDRWVGIIGLTRHFATRDRPIVLASFGTATTIDTLSADNEFLGGLILPGVSMMQEALNRGTARLPNAHGDLQDFPNNTVSAIATGIARAQSGAVLRQMQLAKQRFGTQPTLCVTGGAWSSIEPEIRQVLGDVDIHELPHIVLHGLAILADRSLTKANESS